MSPLPTHLLPFAGPIAALSAMLVFGAQVVAMAAMG